MPRPHRVKAKAGDVDGWPTNQMSDPVSETAWQFALNLKRAVGDQKIRPLGRLAAPDHNTIRKVLTGESWPELITIARLERVLGPLWPGFIEWPAGPDAPNGEAKE